MSASTSGQPCAWQDRFQTPRAGDLLDGLDAELRPVFEQVRDGLNALAGLAENIEWRGIPWRWALVYHANQADLWASLIPEPERPQLALPLPVPLVEDLPITKLSRPVRERLLVARVVNGVIWAEWDLASPTQAEELLGLATRKLNHTGTA